jgi:hypothetical protein
MRGNLSDLTVTVNRDELLAKITANRAQHRAVFEKALKAYRARVLEILEQRIARIRKGKEIDLYFNLPVPQDHTDDYDAVIDMLGMHQSTDIEIKADDYACFVRDDWSWKREWMASTMAYTEPGL